MLCLRGFVKDDSNVTIPYEHYQRSLTPILFIIFNDLDTSKLNNQTLTKQHFCLISTRGFPSPSHDGFGYIEKDLTSQQTNYTYYEQDIYLLICFFMGNLLNRASLLMKRQKTHYTKEKAFRIRLQ